MSNKPNFDEWAREWVLDHEQTPYTEDIASLSAKAEALYDAGVDSASEEARVLRKAVDELWTLLPGKDGHIVKAVRDAIAEAHAARREQGAASMTEERDRYRRRKDEAYDERNRVVALMLRMAIALGWRAGIGTHVDVPGEDWDPEWRTIVTVDLPTGQASWHVHDSQAHLFVGLPKYEGVWDGHTTSEKYGRVERAFADHAPAAEPKATKHEPKGGHDDCG